MLPAWRFAARSHAAVRDIGLRPRSAFAQGSPQGNKGEIDPGAVSDGLKAIFNHTSGNKSTRERLNANTITVTSNS